VHGNILGNAGAITSVLRVPWRRQPRATPPNGWRCLRLGAIITHPCWVARLLGVHITQAATLIISGNTATGIENLEVNGSFYNVEFVFDSAINVYGSPRVFDFKNETDADAAVEAVIAALNGESAVTGVGPQSSPSFLIGYSERTIFGFPFTNSWQGRYIGSWVNTEFDTDEADDNKTYADFTVASDPPPPPGADVISLTAGDVTGDGRAEIIALRTNGIWYWDEAEQEFTQMTTETTTGDIAAGDFNGDGLADVASIWVDGIWYQDGATLEWTKVESTVPNFLTAGDVTGDGRAEIIATFGDGIGTWYWDPTTTDWTRVKPPR
jgi:hypothetical protein